MQVALLEPQVRHRREVPAAAVGAPVPVVIPPGPPRLGPQHAERDLVIVIVIVVVVVVVVVVVI